MKTHAASFPSADGHLREISQDIKSIHQTLQRQHADLSIKTTPDRHYMDICLYIAIATLWADVLQLELTSVDSESGGRGRLKGAEGGDKRRKLGVRSGESGCEKAKCDSGSDKATEALLLLQRWLDSVSACDPDTRKVKHVEFVDLHSLVLTWRVLTGTNDLRKHVSTCSATHDARLSQILARLLQLIAQRAACDEACDKEKSGRNGAAIAQLQAGLRMNTYRQHGELMEGWGQYHVSRSFFAAATSAAHDLHSHNDKANHVDNGGGVGGHFDHVGDDVDECGDQAALDFFSKCVNLTQPTDLSSQNQNHQYVSSEAKFARSKWLLECARQQTCTGGSEDGSLVLGLVYAEEARKLLDTIRREPGAKAFSLTLHRMCEVDTSSSSKTPMPPFMYASKWEVLYAKMDTLLLCAKLCRVLGMWDRATRYVNVAKRVGDRLREVGGGCDYWEHERRTEVEILHCMHTYIHTCIRIHTHTHTCSFYA